MSSGAGLPAHCVCGLLASAQRQFRTGYCFPPCLLGAGCYIYLDMSEPRAGWRSTPLLPRWHLTCRSSWTRLFVARFATTGAPNGSDSAFPWKCRTCSLSSMSSSSLSWRRGNPSWIPQLLRIWWSMSSLCSSTSLSWRRVISHGPGCSADHSDPPVILGQGGQCPCYAGEQAVKIPVVAQRRLPMVCQTMETPRERDFLGKCVARASSFDHLQCQEPSHIYFILKEKTNIF